MLFCCGGDQSQELRKVPWSAGRAAAGPPVRGGGSAPGPPAQPRAAQSGAPGAGSALRNAGGL